MLTEELEKYNEMYRKMIDHLVTLHNANITFQKFQGRDRANDVKRQFRGIMKLSRELIKQCSKVSREGSDRRKLISTQRKEAKRLRQQQRQKNVAVSGGNNQ
ncbi:MAG: hypothetical protein EBU90_04540 [Proteobacteria bacterium]|nr:hypothetical protein [Pseudomonadota bacterium]NBP13710.1 hypothetical protein [bacterium]